MVLVGSPLILVRPKLRHGPVGPYVYVRASTLNCFHSLIHGHVGPSSIINNFVQILSKYVFKVHEKPLVICGHCLVTLPLAGNAGILKWLSSLPVLMQNHSQWW